MSEKNDRYERLPNPPSSVYTDVSPDPTFLQRFRRFSERVLMEAAMEDMRQKFPEYCGPRAKTKRRGPLATAFRKVFVAGFRWTPAPLRRTLTRMMFRDSAQKWPRSEPLGPNKGN